MDLYLLDQCMDEKTVMASKMEEVDADGGD